jgi:O-antigen ligase/polysaccharide polymerase Wzy-like membrane protein
MRAMAAPSSVRPDEALLIGLTGLVLVAGFTVGGHTSLAYAVMAVPVVVGVTWWRPLYGFALLLGLALVTEEFEIDTLAEGIRPLFLQTLPIFRNLKDYTPLSQVSANAIEVWLGLIVLVWLAQSVLSGRLRLRPPPCGVAWLLAGIVLAAAFVAGIMTGGDVKVALWEVRALGYLLGFAWLVPQLVEKRRDLALLLGVMVTALGIKALQGLFRYFVVLGMQLDINKTFMAHEDPVMFVPLFYMLIALWHLDDVPLLRRTLAVATPAMLMALVFTQRRIAYITLMACALFFAAALPTAGRRRFLRVALPLLLVGVAYVAAFAGSNSPLGRPIERAMTLFDSGNESNLYRIIELENLRYTIQRHPWGVGFGHPYEIIRSLPKLDWALYEYIPHNEVLWVWVKAGTLGFVIVLFFFARVLAEAVWTHRHLADGLLRATALVAGLAIVNQLIASYYELQLTYARNMIYLGTLIGLLGPIREWSGLTRRPASPRWRL